MNLFGFEPIFVLPVVSQATSGRRFTDLVVLVHSCVESSSLLYIFLKGRPSLKVYRKWSIGYFKHIFLY